ncbi:hypothetical protein B0H63DRAFT_436730 [Podospora didyma]|uniref:DUF676 domain-containing protein n=1 Tax=Podospora didyma TaxID=330526 RepID=A0AAE0KL19_9PEZI|nr:hypothetical protein B0H63DRAFT_436730 [Podospora didyma]
MAAPMLRLSSTHSRSSLQLPGAVRPSSASPDSSDEEGGNSVYYPRWKSHDPRSSSTQSLSPSLASQEQRRTLLLIYIHGFMGNDSSFRSFPAHVHSFLKDALSDTHVIHTKIYPRYKTYKAIDVACDNFSRWLEPHESPTTDVVLLGHSMGGLLGADVALQPSPNPTYGSSFRHRILGTVSLDAPLLGLHPGIVVSGIASLFRPAPAPPGARESSDIPTPGAEPSGSISPDLSIYSEATSPPLSLAASSLMASPPPQASGTDPYYNPPFFNDAAFIDRGWYKNIAHFVKKHKEENIFGAAANHILSHLEFGGCLADYPGLKSRYSKLRRLEDVDDLHPSPGGGQVPVRVRFINYYTVSTGIPKEKPNVETPPIEALLSPQGGTIGFAIRQGSNSDRRSLDIGSGASTPRISIEDYSDGERPTLLEVLEPMPESDETVLPTAEQQELQPSPPVDDLATTGPPADSVAGETDANPLPPIPDLPAPPQALDLTVYTDKEARKQAEKEAKRAQKVYEQAVKSREKAIKEREKLAEKRRRKSIKDAEKQKQEAQKKEKSKQKKLQKENQATLQKELDALRLSEQAQQQLQGQGLQEKKPKLRKFCMLPGKTNGTRDTAWVQVYMEGVDEVGAHCGLFFPGPHYEKLVGDVGSTIAGWVHEDASRRAILELD